MHEHAGAITRPGALVFCLVATLSGCEPVPAATREPTNTSGIGGATTSATPVTRQARDDLELELALPPAVRAGVAVPITMRVRNRGADPRDLYLLGREPTLDVIITRANGDTVWQRLKGEVLPALLAVRTLAPGERLEVEARWDQRTQAGAAATPGAYVARGLLLTDGAPLAAGPTAFRIEAP